MAGNQYVQYGCGWSAPSGWRNFDASPTLRFERLPIVGRLYTKNQERFPANVEYGNIVRGLPIQNDSCAAVYCSHVLEHLALNEFKLALRETYRLLRKQGLFRLVVPDLKFGIEKYKTDQSGEAAMNFMREMSLGLEHRERSMIGKVRLCFGNSQHLWMWDYASISRELEKCGFVEIRRAKFGDSSDSMFEDVEDPGRWKNCLGVECRK
ncbi:methyltransferase domain-containing protein [Pseudomonadota bacterium]